MLQNILKMLCIITLSTTILNAVNFKFVYSDELESFPSDYVGKPIYMDCKVNGVSEREEGGYIVSASCLDSNNSYGFMGFNPFVLEVVAFDKNLALKISKSKKNKLMLIGKLQVSQGMFIKTHLFNVLDIK